MRAALLVSAGASFACAFYLETPESPLLPAVELLRYGAWLTAMPALIQLRPGSPLARINLVIWLVCVAISLFSEVLGVLLLACAGLANVEQLLRMAPAGSRRGIKLCVIALGTIFAWDLFFYSEYVMLGRPDLQVWNLRGFLIAAMIALLLVGLGRLDAGNPAFFVSRQVAFYSTALLALGLYLVVVALAAQYLQTYGSSWSSLLRPLLLVGAGVVLAALLASESPRRRLRVFLAKHFYRNKYDYREEWMRFVGTLASHEGGDARTASIVAIAQIFESPGGALLLYDEGSSTFALAATWSAEGNISQDIEPLNAECDLIRFMREKGWVIDLDEYQRSPDVYQYIQLPSFLTDKAAWRIVSPLFQRDELQGLIVLQRPPEPFTMTYEDRDLLRMVGRHVATLLAQQAADERLAESRQFDAYNRLVAYVMHDLKNAVAQLQLITSNAARHRDNPEFINDSFITIENTAARITRLISQLQSREAGKEQGRVNIREVLEAACGRCIARAPIPVLEMQSGDCHVIANRDRLVAVFEHVLRNAQEAAGPGGEVRVLLEKADGKAVVTIADTGAGMDPEFVRNRLFRPFDSTKGASGMGIGAYQARAYVLELSGTVEVRSAPGSGTRFIIRIPVCRNDSKNDS